MWLIIYPSKEEAMTIKMLQMLLLRDDSLTRKDLLVQINCIIQEHNPFANTILAINLIDLINSNPAFFAAIDGALRTRFFRETLLDKLERFQKKPRVELPFLEKAEFLHICLSDPNIHYEKLIAMEKQIELLEQLVGERLERLQQLLIFARLGICRDAIHDTFASEQERGVVFKSQSQNEEEDKKKDDLYYDIFYALLEQGEFTLAELCLAADPVLSMKTSLFFNPVFSMQTPNPLAIKKMQNAYRYFWNEENFNRLVHSGGDVKEKIRFVFHALRQRDLKSDGHEVKTNLPVLTDGEILSKILIDRKAHPGIKTKIQEIFEKKATLQKIEENKSASDLPSIEQDEYKFSADDVIFPDNMELFVNNFLPTIHDPQQLLDFAVGVLHHHYQQGDPRKYVQAVTFIIHCGLFYHDAIKDFFESVEQKQDRLIEEIVGSYANVAPDPKKLNDIFTSLKKHNPMFTLGVCGREFLSGLVSDVYLNQEILNPLVQNLDAETFIAIFDRYPSPRRLNIAEKIILDDNFLRILLKIDNNKNSLASSKLLEDVFCRLTDDDKCSLVKNLLFEMAKQVRKCSSLDCFEKFKEFFENTIAESDRMDALINKKDQMTILNCLDNINFQAALLLPIVQKDAKQLARLASNNLTIDIFFNLLLQAPNDARNSFINSLARSYSKEELKELLYKPFTLLSFSMPIFHRALTMMDGGKLLSKEALDGVLSLLPPCDWFLLVATQSVNKYTLIHQIVYFCSNDDTALLTCILDLYQNNNDKRKLLQVLKLKDSDGNTALYNAMSHKRFELLMCMLDALSEKDRFEILEEPNKNRKTVLDELLLVENAPTLNCVCEKLDSQAQQQVSQKSRGMRVYLSGPSGVLSSSTSEPSRDGGQRTKRQCIP